MKLEGSLATFPLRELVEMVMYSSVTGVLEVHTDDGPGRLFFDDGRPYHAVFGAKSGTDAARELFLDPDAQFLFVADVMSDDGTLWNDPIEMLDQCEAFATRMLQTRQAVPGIDWVPSTIADGSSQVSIAEDDWRVLTLIDGERSVEDIAAEMFCDIVEVCESLQRMVERGLVRMQRPQEARRASALPHADEVTLPSALHAQAEQAVATTRTKLLDRLLDALPLLEEQPTAAPVAPTLPPKQVEEERIVKLLRNI